MSLAPKLSLNDGKTIPAIGFGTYPMKGEEVKTAVKEALSTGYRLIDTAASYENEDGVGKAINESEIPREDIFLSTKLRGAEQGYDSALRALDNSLKRLQAEYVDLYLIHWPLPKKGLYVESWKALIEAQKAGKVRSIGVSNFTPAQLERLIQETGVTPVVNQIELHADFPQEKVTAFNKQHNILTQAWTPLGKGLMDNPTITSIAEKHGRNAGQIMLRWVTQLPAIPLPKSGNVERMRANLNIFDFTLDADDLKKIASLAGDNRIGGDPDTYEEF